MKAARREPRGAASRRVARAPSTGGAGQERREGVGVGGGEGVPESVREGVREEDGKPGEAEREEVAVALMPLLPVVVALPVGGGVREAEGVPLLLAVSLGEALALGELVAVRLSLAPRVLLEVGVAVPLGEAVLLGVGEAGGSQAHVRFQGVPGATSPYTLTTAVKRLENQVGEGAAVRGRLRAERSPHPASSPSSLDMRQPSEAAAASGVVQPLPSSSWESKLVPGLHRLTSSVPPEPGSSGSHPPASSAACRPSEMDTRTILEPAPTSASPAPQAMALKK